MSQVLSYKNTIKILIFNMSIKSKLQLCNYSNHNNMQL